MSSFVRRHPVGAFRSVFALTAVLVWVPWLFLRWMSPVAVIPIFGALLVLYFIGGYLWSIQTSKD